MTCASPPEYLSVAEVCRRCREETARYQRREPHDDRFCWEMIRRAVGQRDDDCWQALTEIYHAAVAAWCRRAGGDPPALDDLVTEVWAKFWRHFTLAKLAPDSGAAGVLKYIKMCARSVVMDHGRARSRDVPLESAAHRADATPTPADTYAEQATRDELWQLVESSIRNERERVVMHLTYVVGMKPAEIAAESPDLFPSAKEVYSTTRNVLDRLRRSDRLRAWLEREDR